jgi:RES domain
MGRYPRGRIEARLHLFAIDGVHRVFGVSRMPLQLHSSPSRFCDGKSGFAVMYAALSFETCIVEKAGHDKQAQLNKLGRLFRRARIAAKLLHEDVAMAAGVELSARRSTSSLRRMKPRQLVQTWVGAFNNRNGGDLVSRDNSTHLGTPGLSRRHQLKSLDLGRSQVLRRS